MNINDCAMLLAQINSEDIDSVLVPFLDSERAKQALTERDYPELAQELKEKGESLVWGESSGFGYFCIKASDMPLSCYVAMKARVEAKISLDSKEENNC